MVQLRFPSASPFARKVGILFSGNAVGQAIPIVLSPVIARLYPPADFGVFSLYLGIVGVAAVISTGRYELAILLPKRTQMADALLILSLVLVIATTLAVSISLAFLEQKFAITIREPFGEWVFLIPIAIFFRGAIQSFVFFHTRRANYRIIAAAKIAQGSTLGIVQIALGLVGFGAGGLIIGSILSYALSATVSGSTVLTNVSLRRARAWRAIRKVRNRYSNFPRYNLPHAALRASTSNLPVLALSMYFTDTEVGLYAMCFGITVLPLSLISQPIFQVFSQELTQRWRHSPVSALDLARSLRRRVVTITFLPAVVAVILAPSVFAFVLGEQWRESGELFRWLSPMIIMSFISSNFSFIPQLVGGQRKAMVLEIIGFGLMVLSMAVGGAIGNLRITLLLFSSSAALLTGYRLAWYFALLKSKVNEAQRPQV